MMARLDKETITLELDVYHETNDAYMVHNLKDERVWLPKSQVEFHEEGLSTEFEMPMWLAEDKDLV